MEMQEILKDLETKLENQNAVVTLYETKVKSLQEEFDRAQKALNEEMAKLANAKNDADALDQAIEMLKMGSFAQKKAAVKTETKADVKTTVKKTAKATKLDWKHKSACVVKLNEYDNILDRWRSQNAAARAMNWDQSSVSKFMRLDKDTQLRKKGFYLTWEY